MKKILLSTSIFALITIGLVSTAKAQIPATRVPLGTVVSAAVPATPTAAPTSTVTTSIVEVLDLAVTSQTTSNFDFSNITTLDKGITNTNAVDFMFRSNKPWFVSIKADGANFTGGDASTPMPATTLQYSFTGVNTFTPLTETATFLGGSTAQARGAGTFSLDYKMNPGYNYGPGNYSLGITYTITNQ
ncbi:MAG TPA: hypothetical protein VEV16_05315 [Daejeonella sp.]|nr:hypothetical protein [Daejeonella sp.]